MGLPHTYISQILESLPKIYNDSFCVSRRPKTEVKTPDDDRCSPPMSIPTRPPPHHSTGHKDISRSTLPMPNYDDPTYGHVEARRLKKQATELTNDITRGVNTVSSG